MDTILNATIALIVILALKNCKNISFTISTIHICSSELNCVDKCYLGLFKIPTVFILTTCTFVIFFNNVPYLLVFMAKWKFPWFVLFCFNIQGWIFLVLLPSVCFSTLYETFFRQIGLVCCQSSLMPKGRDFVYECHIIV